MVIHEICKHKVWNIKFKAPLYNPFLFSLLPERQLRYHGFSWNHLRRNEKSGSALQQTGDFDHTRHRHLITRVDDELDRGLGAPVFNAKYLYRLSALVIETEPGKRINHIYKRWINDDPGIEDTTWICGSLIHGGLISYVAHQQSVICREPKDVHDSTVPLPDSPAQRRVRFEGWRYSNFLGSWRGMLQ